jgi:hypothetical protein
MGSARCRSAWSVHGWRRAVRRPSTPSQGRDGRGSRLAGWPRGAPRAGWPREPARGMAAGAGSRDGRGSRVAGWPREPRGGMAAGAAWRDGRGSRVAGWPREPARGMAAGAAGPGWPRAVRAPFRARGLRRRRGCQMWHITRTSRRDPPDRLRGPAPGPPAGSVLAKERRRGGANRADPGPLGGCRGLPMRGSSHEWRTEATIARPDPPFQPELGLAQRATAGAAVGPRPVVKGRDLAALLDGTTCRLRWWPRLAAGRPGVRRAGHANAGADSRRRLWLQMTVGRTLRGSARLIRAHTTAWWASDGEPHRGDGGRLA